MSMVPCPRRCAAASSIARASSSTGLETTQARLLCRGHTQSLVTGAHTSGCAEATRRVWDNYRAYLPAGHPMRAASGFHGRRCDDPIPPARTHEGYVRDGLANEAHRDRLLDAGLDARRRGIFKKDFPYKTTGVKECCPLRFYPLFDLVWDIMPDMMHLGTGIWQRHIFELLKGGRAPAPVKAKKKNTAAQNEALRSEHEKCKAHVKDWAVSAVCS